MLGSKPETTTPLVSIVIPTLNSERTLSYCLDAAKAQTYSPIEVVVVDSFSTDSTVSIALNHTARVLMCRGLLHQRLLGVQKCKGDFILLLDSDQLLSPDAVAECVRMAAEDDHRMLFLQECSVTHEQNRIAVASKRYMEAFQTMQHPLVGVALPRFFSRKVLEFVPDPGIELGYFDHDYIYLKAYESGARTETCQAFVFHLEQNDLGKVFRKFLRYYGCYWIAAFKVDPRLPFAKSLPRFRTLTMGEGHARRASGQLIGLYLAKSLATVIGFIFSLFRGRNFWYSFGERSA